MKGLTFDLIDTYFCQHVGDLLNYPIQYVYCAVCLILNEVNEKALPLVSITCYSLRMNE